MPSAVTPVIVAPELAAAALASEAITAALQLATWVGYEGKHVTARAVLSPGPALDACAALGIELPPGKTKLRSMLDVPVLVRDWNTAVSAGLILVGGGSARRAVEGNDGPDVATLTAWLRAITEPLAMPDDECAQWLAAVAVLASADGDSVTEGADGGSVTVGEVRDAVFGAVDDKEADERADQWLDDWVFFGALVPVDGGSLRITPLGRLLTDSVTAMLTPAAAEDAAAVVQRFITVPVRVAVRYLTGWLAVRGVVAAAGELIDFAGSATPYQRAIAIDLAAELGPDAAPAWRERARLPGYGAYVREWLADQGEEVPDFPGDQAWMAAELFTLALEEAPPGLGEGKVAWVIKEMFDNDDPLPVLKESGHPDAERLTRLVEGAPLSL
jgi:hypothetical protein